MSRDRRCKSRGTASSRRTCETRRRSTGCSTSRSAWKLAEHLPAEHASAFVPLPRRGRSRGAFLAAIPGQGGRDHVNEQWQDYWREKFAEIGYVPVDAIRPRIWGRPDVAVWYQQNMVLYCAPRTVAAAAVAPAGAGRHQPQPGAPRAVFGGSRPGRRGFRQGFEAVPELAVAAARRRFASHAA